MNRSDRRALELERQRALEFLQSFNSPAAARRNTIYDSNIIGNMFAIVYTCFEAMIATVFGHEIGRDLARHPEEKFWKFLCSVLVMGTILYLFCHSAYILSIIPAYLANFMRRRSLPNFSLVITMALLSYILMKMYSCKMEMEAKYIVLNLGLNNLLVGLLYQVYGDGGFEAAQYYLWSTVIISHAPYIISHVIKQISRYRRPTN